MENQKSNNGLKAVILVLILALLGSLYYNFKLSNESNKLEADVKNVSTEKENILKDLEELKNSYDAALAENTTMSDELIAEREKVVQLMEEVKRTKGDVSSLSKYKQMYFNLESKNKSLLQEVEVLKAQNQELTTNLDSTKVVLEESKNYNQVLVGQNEELTKTVEKGSKLSVLNLQTAAYKQKSSGKEIETDKARRADLLKVSFTIAENNIAKSGDKTYYVQVIDSKNNVLGDKVTTSFGDKSLTYSFLTTVQYENKTVKVTENLKGTSFEKGTYFVNIFDKGELVSKSSFTLK
jgi:myosin heavy subunit